MEYVDGERLEDRCPERLDEIVDDLHPVADGLHAMHMAGLRPRRHQAQQHPARAATAA